MTNSEFSGQKFFCTEETTITDCWGHSTTKPVFKMTKQYYRFLVEKEQKQRQLELLSLKSKLDYQMKTYNEVDQIDYNHYIALLEEYQKTEIDQRNDIVKLSDKLTEVAGSYNSRCV